MKRFYWTITMTRGKWYESIYIWSTIMEINMFFIFNLYFFSKSVGNVLASRLNSECDSNRFIASCGWPIEPHILTPIWTYFPWLLAYALPSPKKRQPTPRSSCMLVSLMIASWKSIGSDYMAQHRSLSYQPKKGSLTMVEGSEWRCTRPGRSCVSGHLSHAWRECLLIIVSICAKQHHVRVRPRRGQTVVGKGR
jgi:hypothetical protein